MASDPLPESVAVGSIAGMSDRTSDHQFLRYVTPPPARRVVREIAVDLMNYFFQQALSRSRWLKVPPTTAGCYETSRDKAGTPVTRNWRSLPFTVRDLEQHLERGTFDHEPFQLFSPRSDWLDDGIDFSTNGHVTDPTGEVLKFRFPLAGLGPGFPLVPELDREGWIVSSFQRVSHSRISRLHRAVVERSHQFTGIDWLDDVRVYVCECISLIDMMLHQLYLKAEHAPEPGWQFNAGKLGVRHGRRVADKLCWVGQITRKPLDDAEQELADFNTLRAVRNHVQHFDPPSFACSLEGDVVGWLNACGSVARLAWKIRRRVGAPLTEELIALLLLPAVEFMPLNPSAPRAALVPGVGYASTCWPIAHHEGQ